MMIGQAQAILMERLGIDADLAFAYLRRISQSENRKLITICNHIVETRQLPTDKSEKSATFSDPDRPGRPDGGIACRQARRATHQ
jgi:ANTAR domain